MLIRKTRSGPKIPAAAIGGVAAPLASSQRVPGSTPGAALHLELLVAPLPLNLSIVCAGSRVNLPR